MQAWAICFVIFFGAAELFQWLQGLTLPFPVFVVAGALLAIASNADRWSRFADAAPQTIAPTAKPPETIDTAPAMMQPPTPEPPRALPRYYPGPQLPNFHPPSQRSISFTIDPPPQRSSQSEE